MVRLLGLSHDGSQTEWTGAEDHAETGHYTSYAAIS
jgi:hypothetical protein